MSESAFVTDFGALLSKYGIKHLATTEELNSCRMIIYGIYNTVEQKWYIGQTIYTFHVRYSNCNWVKYATNGYLRYIANRDGVASFQIYLLAKNVKTKERLDELEKNFIQECRAIYPDGYNFESGGQQYNKRVHAVSRRKVKEYQLKQRAKERIIYDVHGTRYTFNNLSTFAEEHGLNTKILSSLFKRDRLLSYKGWHLEGTDLRKPQRNSEERQIVGPDGVVYQFFNPSEFAREHGLANSHVYHVLNGKLKSIHGYHLPDGIDRPMGLNWRSAYSPKRKYTSVVLVKNGKEYTLTDRESVEGFCAGQGISRREIYTLTSGKQKTSRGFRLVKTVPYVAA